MRRDIVTTSSPPAIRAPTWVCRSAWKPTRGKSKETQARSPVAAQLIGGKWRAIVVAEDQSVRLDPDGWKAELAPLRSKDAAGASLHRQGLWKGSGRGGRGRHHGGMSTGPRTAEGRAGVAAFQSARWKRWRAQQQQ